MSYVDKDECEWLLGSCSQGNEFPRPLLTLRARLYLFNRTPFILFDSCEMCTSEFHHFNAFSLQCCKSHCAFYYKILWGGEYKGGKEGELCICSK